MGWSEHLVPRKVSATTREIYNGCLVGLEIQHELASGGFFVFEVYFPSFRQAARFIEAVSVKDFRGNSVELCKAEMDQMVREA